MSSVRHVSADVAEDVAHSFVFATWTHHHVCDFGVYNKLMVPKYVPLFIPSRLPKAIASTLVMPEHLSAELVSVDGVASVRHWPGCVPSNVNGILAVHCTRTSQDLDTSAIFVAATRFNRGDVLAVVDPHWPIPKWLSKALDGLETVPGNMHDSCIIRPDRTIREASNAFLTTRSFGPYIPCSKIDEVANAVLNVHQLLKWEVVKDGSERDIIKLPHVMVVAKGQIFLGDRVLLEHSKFARVDVAPKATSPRHMHAATTPIPKVSMKISVTLNIQVLFRMSNNCLNVSMSEVFRTKLLSLTTTMTTMATMTTMTTTTTTTMSTTSTMATTLQQPTMTPRQ